MRKVLSVVLAATMVMSLAVCGGSSAKTDTKAADAGTAAGDEASADDYYITIKFSNVFQPAEWNYKASEYLADLVKRRPMVISLWSITDRTSLTATRSL